MVLLSGPRQSGKTTLAKSLMRHYQYPVYLNYDEASHREVIHKQSWLPSTDLLILDEMHKMPDWKNYLKGVFDVKRATQHLLVTGSARLEIFSEVGDPLAGRYFMHRLLPFSISELHALGEAPAIERMLNHGNFPEPYLSELTDAKRWRQQYVDSLIRTDVLDFKNIHDVRSIQMVFELLRRRVGSPISFQAISEDVGIAPNTVKKYISILEALYVVFLVRPYHKNIARSTLKAPKIYFYDVGMVQGDQGAVIGNLVAVSLLKHCFGLRDYQAKPYGLQYIRTKEKREIDFALVLDDTIEQAIEVKLSDTNISGSLRWFVKKYGCQGSQVVHTQQAECMQDGIALRQLTAFLKRLWPVGDPDQPQP